MRVIPAHIVESDIAMGPAPLGVAGLGGGEEVGVRYPGPLQDALHRRNRGVSVLDDDPWDQIDWFKGVDSICKVIRIQVSDQFRVQSIMVRA